MSDAKFGEPWRIESIDGGVELKFADGRHLGTAVYSDRYVNALRRSCECVNALEGYEDPAKVMEAVRAYVSASIEYDRRDDVEWYMDDRERLDAFTQRRDTLTVLRALMPAKGGE